MRALRRGAELYRREDAAGGPHRDHDVRAAARVRVKQDFTADKAKLREVIQLAHAGEDKDGDGVRDTRRYRAPPSDRTTPSSASSTPIASSRRCRRPSRMLRPFPEQKSLVYFASNLRLNGTDNNAQLRATMNAAIRANVTINPVDARGLVAMAPLGDATQRVPRRRRHVLGQLADDPDRRASSARRTRSIRWPRTPAARRCSTTTTCRWASSRRRTR